MRPGTRLCDLPAGGGYLASYVPPQVKYTAVEPTATFASLFVPSENQEVVIADPCELPFDDGVFDMVVSLAGLHHEPQKCRVLREIARVTKAGGMVIIADVAEASNEDRFLNGFVDMHSDMGHKGIFLGTEFAEEVHQSGMKILHDEIVSLPWVYKSTGDAACFAKDLFGIDAPLETIESGLREVIGLNVDDDEVRIDWHLRRLICHNLKENEQ
jgi:SAM-dependent methyltransferase